MVTLVTGASGFVGSLLVPRLLDAGHSVRALGREEGRMRDSLAPHLDLDAGEIELVRGDALMGEGLDRALEGVDVAYYLIHSMESPSAAGVPFSERDRVAAENFAAAAARAGAGRIVYLGGLLPAHESIAARARHANGGRGGATPVGDPAGVRPSRHLASRAEVERILLGAVPGSVALRASIVIGARSRSFRLLVRLVERMPVLTLPAWRRHRTRPIDQRDVIAMLVS
ncbi:MAG TPA: NAD(P)H-binding protein, partial [Solirubrobacteraceae bacterium]|nr:NAD(P)H-binding protein [Solirubrobacteraceae bacterium]